MKKTAGKKKRKALVGMAHRKWRKYFYFAGGLRMVSIPSIVEHRKHWDISEWKDLRPVRITIEEII